MRTSIIMDLTESDDARALKSLAAWVEETSARGYELILVVNDRGYLAEMVTDEDVVLVTVSANRQTLGDRWGLAVQSAGEDRVMIVPQECAPVPGLFLWESPALEAVSTIGSNGAEAIHIYALFDIADYAAVRGFNARMVGPHALLHDLFSRMDVLGQRVEFDNAESPHGPLLANLPVWRYPPPGSDPMVSVVMIIEEGQFVEDGILAVLAQTFDDLSVHVVDWQGSASVKRWFDTHDESIPLRFGAKGVLTYHDLSGKSAQEAWAAVVSGVGGRYVFLLDGRDLLLPWTVETILRHLRPGVCGVTGVRVLYDSETGGMSPTVSRDVPRAVMVPKGELARWEPLLHSKVTERNLAEELLESRTGWQVSPMATTLRAGTDHSGDGPRWRTPWGDDPIQICSACLPDDYGHRDVLVRQACVSKVEEIDAYDRISALTTEFDAQGRPRMEACVIRGCTYKDLAALSRAGVGFELTQAQLGPSGVGSAGSRELGRRLLSRLRDADPDMSGEVCLEVTPVASAAAVDRAFQTQDESVFGGWVYHHERPAPPQYLLIRRLNKVQAQSLLKRGGERMSSLFTAVPIWKLSSDDNKVNLPVVENDLRKGGK